LKTGSGKAGKKRDTSLDVPNLAAVTPVQTAEPQKQILPLALALALPDEHAKPDDNPHDNPQDPSQKAGSAVNLSVTSATPLAELPNAAQLKPSVTLNPSAPLKPAPESAQSAEPAQAPKLRKAGQPVDPKIPTASATPDFSQIQIQPLPAEVPMPDQAAKSGDPPTASARAGMSSESQSASRAQLKLADAIPPEPVAAAVQKIVNSAPSTPSALAFAARLAPVPQKTDQPVPGNPSQSSAAPGSQTTARIPVRYTAAAQVVQGATAEMKPSAGGVSTRADFRVGIALPQIELEAPPSSGPSAPQPAAPSAPVERIIEPPAAPPTSAHDIRVQVPDDKGGSTQVRFVESGGEVRVSVRTADEGLAQSLRSHLTDLTQRLTDGGLPAEIWKPAAASPQNNQPQPDREGRGSGGQQPGGQGGQQDRQQKRPAWLDEMEASLHGTTE
jgi:hypothetical protein